MQFHLARDITVSPNRQRRVFDAAKILDLAESLKKLMLQPIVIRNSSAGPVLVAGERRLRAVEQLVLLNAGVFFQGETLPPGMIPCVTTGELDELAREEAEFEENTQRLDLSFLERAEATARLFTLRSARADREGRAGPTTREIAEQTRGSGEGYHHEATRRELIVARHSADPEVRASKTLDDAYKAIKRKEEGEKNRALGEEVGRNYTSSVHTALQDDALAWLTKCPPEYFDVILTDPPYGMGADEFGDAGGRTTGSHTYRDGEDDFKEILEAACIHFIRVAKQQAHLYWFCDLDNFHEAKECFSSHGWWVHRTPLIWHKPGNARIPWPEHGPQRKYELILYAVKGKRNVTRIAPDVITINPEPNLGHSAQKPVALFTDLLSRSVHPGDAVLDPFMGTGTIFPAAHGLKCRATGLEIDQAAYGIAVGRLKALDKQGELL